MALMGRAYSQALKFGVEVAIPDEVASLQAPQVAGEPEYRLILSNGERVRARAVIIASGAAYRRLQVENLAAFECSSVHYWASPVEGRLCTGQEVAIVGAGNSAGQAGVFGRPLEKSLDSASRPQSACEHVELLNRADRRASQRRGSPADRDQRS
ncbi:MAG: NAD(P)/FAD-dependent oxidoreductase [Burkholderiales bacterium]